MIKTFKYRLYPNKSQQVLFLKTFGCVRFVWNNYVEVFKSYNRENNPKPIYKTPKELKQKFEWLGEVSYKALEQKIRDFEKAKMQFFNKGNKIKNGYPKFKNKYSKQSYRLSNNNFKLEDNKVKLTKVGWVKYKKDRELLEDSRILSATISENNINQYYISITFEIKKENYESKKQKPNLGIDLGVSSLATLSDGLQFENPKCFDKNHARLKKAQRHLSRKKKGSNRYKKQKLKVSNIYNKIKNQRDWHLHNISRYIVDNYNEIGMEDLRVDKMMKSKLMSKLIADASMSKLKRFITYKQKFDYNKEVALLGTFEPSTKECNECGNIQHMKLTDREFVCTGCGNVIMDRDLNASKTILRKTVGVTTDYKRGEIVRPKVHSNVKWRLISGKRSELKLNL
jgi:putative transposase